MDIQKPLPTSLQQSVAPGTLTVRPLLLKPQWMNGLSERLLVSHYENNYGGALRRLNAIRERARLLSTGAHTRLRDQRPQARRADRCGLGDPARGLFRFARRTGRQSADRACRAARRARPGAGTRFRQRHGLARRVHRDGQGAGRRFRLGDPRLVRALGRLVNQWAADHAHGLPGRTPILALDMYEHAYHLDFGAKAAAYVDQVMANLNWERIGARYRLAIGEGAAEDELFLPYRRAAARGGADFGRGAEGRARG